MTIGLKTRFTFGLLAIMASPIIGLIVIYLKMDSIQQDIRKSWTIPHQYIWSEQLKAGNPNMIVPRVDDVVRVIGAETPK